MQDEKQPPKPESHISIYESLKLGSVSYSISMLFYPVEMIATISKSYSSKKEVDKIIKQKLSSFKNFMTFFKGSYVVFWENIPPVAVYFFLYDKTKKFLEKSSFFGPNLLPICSSAVAEAFCLVIQTPFETVRTRIQSNKVFYRYNGIWDGFASIGKYEGYMRLYSASYLYIVITMFYTTIQFYIFERYLDKYQEKEGAFDLKASVVGAFFGTSASVVLTNPFDNLVVRYQNTNFMLEKTKNLTFWIIFKNKVYDQGFEGMMRGVLWRLLVHQMHSLAILPLYRYYSIQHELGPKK